MIADFQDQLEHNREAEKRQKIDNKIMSGGSLSPEEISYLEKNDPVALKKYRETKEEKEPIEEDDDVNSEEDEKAQMEKLLDNLEQEKEDEDYEYPKKLSNKKLEEVYISLLLANPKAISMYYIEKRLLF